MSATVASGRVFDAFLGPDLGERTLYHGHSYSGNALAAAVALRHLELLDAWDVLANVRARSDELRGLLDDRIAPHPAVREVRLLRADGRRRARAAGRRPALGTAGVRGRGRARRAAAPARRRGRAHAAAHRHVGGAAPHRARARRRARRGDRRDREPGSDWADDEATRVRDAGQWRAPRDLDAAGADGHARRPTAARWCRSRRTTTSASPSTPRSSPPRTTRSTGGAPGPGAARLIVGSRPVHHELEAELAAGRAPRRAVLFPTGFAANLGVLTTFAGPDVLVCSDELNHASIIDGRRLAGAPLAVYRHGDAAHVDELLRARTHRARDRRHRDRVLDGRRRRAGRRARSTCARATARCSCSTRPTRCSARSSSVPPTTSTVLRVGTLSKTLGALGGFVAGPQPLHRPAREPRPLLHLHHRVEPRPTPPPRSPRCGVLRSPEGDELRGAAARQRRPAAPRAPVADRPVRAAATRQRALDGGRRAARRAACWSPPSGRRRCRRARRACGSRCRPRTPPSRSTGSPPRWPSCSPTAVTRPPRTLVFVAGTGTEVGKTWWTRGAARASCAPAGVHGRGAQAGAVGRARRDRPTPTCSPPPPARSPHTVCPPHRTLPVAVGAADGRRRARAAAVHHRRPRGRARLARRRRGRPRRRRRRAALADRADGDNVDLAPRSRPDLVVLVADAGLGTINAVRLSVGAFADFPVVVALNRYGTTTRCTPATASTSTDGRRLRRGHRTARSSPTGCASRTR